MVATLAGDAAQSQMELVIVQGCAMLLVVIIGVAMWRLYDNDNLD